MRARFATNPRLLRLVRDPMIRLVMASDGVTEAEIVGVFSNIVATPAPPDQQRESRKMARRATRKWLATFFSERSV